MADIHNTLEDYSGFTPIQGNPGRLYFEAIQNGTNRTVILEIVDKACLPAEEASKFLEETKIKACVDFPHVCSILEAGERENLLFLSREKPSGSSLEELRKSAKKISSADLLLVLGVVSGAEIYFEQKGINTSLINLCSIYIGENGVSLLNPAVPGDRPEAAGHANMEKLATLLEPLIPTGTPGATRLSTICKIMKEGHMGAPVDWEQIREMSQTVLEQINQHKGGSTRLVESALLKTQTNWRKIGIIIMVFLLLAGSIASFLHFNGKEEEPAPPPRNKTPNFLNRDHTLIPVVTAAGTKLECDAHEVTIGAYKRFIDSLDNMPESGKKQFDSPNQPKVKKNHIPADWKNMLSAAQSNSMWQGRKLSMRSPIVNIDYWDAHAYAAWKGHRLPTMDEWISIAKTMNLNGKGDSACPVDMYSNDVDKTGICGFASGVKEWTSSMERDVTRPTDPPKRTSCGGFYSSPGLKKVNYEPSSEERSPDLGFRTLRN